VKGFILWITGRPGSGKTALARAVEGALLERGGRAEVLDERDFGVLLAPDGTDADAVARRLALVAGLLARNGVAALVAAHSPSRATREEFRANAESAFIEAFCDGDETGRGAYEPPAAPEIIVDHRHDAPDDACARVLLTLERLGLVPKLPGGAYTPEEEEEVRRRLKDLGYV
jgi:adenylylsulfate kinase-like enzyme